MTVMNTPPAEPAISPAGTEMDPGDHLGEVRACVRRGRGTAFGPGEPDRTTPTRHSSALQRLTLTLSNP